MIKHTYADNIESLFYVFIWIIVLYDGPLGREREGVGHENTLLLFWSEAASKNLETAKFAKFTFLVSKRSDCHDRFLPGRSLVQRGTEGRRCSKPQGLKWLRGDAPQRRVDARVSDARESSTQGSRSLQRRFWVGSERVRLRAKALKSEQGFGCSRASFT